MRKILFFLFFLPLLLCGQTAFDIIKNGYERNAITMTLLKIDLSTLENKPLDPRFEKYSELDILKEYSNRTVKEILEDNDVSDKQYLIKKFKRELLDSEKRGKGLKFLHLLNMSPVTLADNKNYFELYWKTVIESLPFVDDYSFRERVGHSYRNELDYMYQACHYSSILASDSRENVAVIFSLLADKEWFERDSLENGIELFAKYTPLLLFILFLWILYKVDVLLNFNIFKKYNWFGFIDNYKLRRRLRVIIIIIFLLFQILISDTLLFANALSFASSNESLYSSGAYSWSHGIRVFEYMPYSIESSLDVEWNIVIAYSFVFWFISYFLTLLFNIRSLIKLKTK